MDESFNQENVDEKLFWNLSEAGHVIHYLSAHRSSQKKILIMLNENGAITQRELTERLRVQSASSSEILSKMELAGLITRIPSLKDRRTMEIALTPEGKEKAKAAKAQIMALHQEMFECLNGEEKEIFLPIIEKLNREWDGRYRDNADRNSHKSGEQCRHGSRHEK
ncbi:MAG: MarR family winged helix-turn-helix transcriptional regulator [Bariatricus sp.]